MRVKTGLRGPVGLIFLVNLIPKGGSVMSKQVARVLHGPGDISARLTLLDMSYVYGRAVILPDAAVDYHDTPLFPHDAGIIVGSRVSPGGDAELIVAHSNGRMRCYHIGELVLARTWKDVHTALLDADGAMQGDAIWFAAALALRAQHRDDPIVADHEMLRGISRRELRALGVSLGRIARHIDHNLEKLGDAAPPATSSPLNRTESHRHDTRTKGPTSHANRRAATPRDWRRSARRHR